MRKSSSRATFSRGVLTCTPLLCVPALIACSGEDVTMLDSAAPVESPSAEFEHAYAAASVVFSDEGETSYVMLLPNLETHEVPYR